LKTGNVFDFRAGITVTPYSLFSLRRQFPAFVIPIARPLGDDIIRPLNVRFASKATDLLHCREVTPCANYRHLLVLGRIVIIEYEVHGAILATGVPYDYRFISGTLIAALLGASEIQRLAQQVEKRAADVDV
jgi:hypothetical protein